MSDIETVAESSPVVLTLVHGTWSQNASWLDEDSALVRGLRQQLRHCTITRFPWTGSNSHSSRLKAADELRLHLSKQKCEHPHAKHIVIAHSHGGNVALYAQRDASFVEAADGIACLATPFVICKRRMVGPTLTLMQFAAPVIVTVPLFALCAVVLAFTIVRISSFLAALPEWALFVGGLLVLGGLAKLVIGVPHSVYRWSVDRLPRWVEQKASEVHRRMQLPITNSLPLFVAAHPNDEAVGWLSIGAALANVPFRFWFVPAIAGAQFSRLFLKLWLPILLLFGIGSGISAQIWGEDVVVLATHALVVLMSTALWVAIFAAFALFVMAIVPRVRANPFVFGWESFAANAFTSISTQCVPPATAELHVVSPGIRERKGFSLLHSMIYEDPVIIAELARWISKVSASRSSPSGA